MTSVTTGSPTRGPGLSGWSGRTIITVMVTVFVLFFAVPMLWLLLATTKTARDLIVGAPFTPGSADGLATNWNQLFAFQDGAVTTWIANSAGYAVGALVITLFASIPAGYALALTEFRFRRALLVLTLVIMLIPNTALVLPIFLELNAAGLIGSPLSVILPMSFFPFGVYLTYIYFSTSIPRDLLAAARIDGCREWQVFTRVALPLAAPIVALVAFFSFVQNWNNFFLPFVMLPSSEGYPVQVGLTSLLASTPAFNPSSAGSQSVQLPTLALATVVSVLPVLIVFLVSQRFLVAGMTAGGTKE
ncbi:sugar ABC transporter permease [Actinoplanes philippinensis]|uniref:Multiple sugar transport system permease protein n=1 Tax=Actinoplanes philippinensis TaxID=35752 RepID=A0A1I2E6Y1_9ACTN|nr:carbohydrate ABC transporter permease [Actinoplanes philippinensis]GIE77231.1 sugar ABC transporter permease [Actinoplanes philippinensis]SFE88467.1 multiple sugar transport system permease protein [Actinoplanes philippinensis]